MASPPPPYSPAFHSPLASAPLNDLNDPDDIPAVPGPSVARRTPSPYARGSPAGHHRSISESAHLLKTSPHHNGRLHPSAALHQHHPHPAGEGHTRAHTLDSHTPPLPSDHAGPSTFHRTPSQSRSAQSSHRHRSASGPEHHFRCGPDCAAAEAPYRLLARVIGRASVSNSRKGSAERHSSREDKASMRSPKRINIQTRRSQSRSAAPSSPDTPLWATHEDTALKPLAFDRRLIQTPPIEVVSQPMDRIPAAGGDFFAAFNQGAHTASAVLHHSQEPFYEFDIPRSNSAPEVPLLTDHVRRLSTVSSASIGSSDANFYSSPPFPPEGPQAFALEREDTDVTIRASPVPRPAAAIPVPAAGIATNRFATVGSGRSEPTHLSTASFDEIIGDPLELSGYLGADLAATLKRRIQGDKDEAKVTKRKEEHVSDADWSFSQPLAAAMGSAVHSVVRTIPKSDSYHIAEYCCGWEVPNVVLADAIKSLCIRSVGTRGAERTFVVTHQCAPDFDIRLLQAALATSPHSYRKVKTLPSPSILTSFSLAGLTEAAVLPDSVDLALCGAELSKLHGVVAPKSLYAFTSQAEDREKLADRELTEWLKARRKEMKPGGVLVCSFAIRTSPPLSSDHNTVEQPRASPYHTSMSLPTSPRTSVDAVLTPMTEINNSPFVSGPPLPTPPVTEGKARPFRPDIWQSMSHALSPAIQRLVSLGEIRTHVAPALVDVPYWPRTLGEVRKTLGKAPEWDVIREGEDYEEQNTKRLIGLGIQDGPEMDVDHHDQSLHSPPAAKAPIEGDSAYCYEERKEWSDAGIRIHRLTHPAWKAYKSGKIDRASYARRIATYVRWVYEAHLKKVLREKGRLDIGQSESLVQELFKIVVEKCELGALDALELDVGVVVLRRR